VKIERNHTSKFIILDSRGSDYRVPHSIILCTIIRVGLIDFQVSYYIHITNIFLLTTWKGISICNQIIWLCRTSFPTQT